MEVIVVSKNPAFLEYCVKRGIVPSGTPIFGSIAEKQVKGKQIVTDRLLPLHLCAKAEIISHIYLKIDEATMRNRLSIQEIEACAQKIRHYSCKELELSK